MAHPYLDNLVEARQRAWDEGKKLLDDAAAETRELTAEEESKWQAINVDIDAKDAQISEIRAAEEREAEAAVARQAYESTFGEARIAQHDQRQAYDLAAFLRGEEGRSVEFDFSAVAREKRLIRSGAGEREIRDLIEDTTTAGGYTVPTSFLRRLYDFLEWYSGVRQLNVTVLTTTSGEALQIPKVATHGTAALKGEGTALAEADPTFGQVTLGAWKYGVLTQISNELLTDSAVDVEGFVAEDAARAIARVTDTDYVTGSGASKPAGCMTGLTIGATAQTAATGVPSYGNLVDLVYSVNPVNRAQGAQWLALDTNIAKLRKILDANNIPLWQPSVQAGEPDTLLGYPIVQDPNVRGFATAAGTNMAFGNYRGFYVRDVGTIRFERSDDFAFSTDLVTYRTILRTDSDWVDASGVRGLKEPTT